MCNSKLFGKYGSNTFTIIRSHTSHPQVKLGEKNSRHWLLKCCIYYFLSKTITICWWSKLWLQVLDLMVKLMLRRCKPLETSLWTANTQEIQSAKQIKGFNVHPHSVLKFCIPFVMHFGGQWSPTALVIWWSKYCILSSKMKTFLEGKS